VVQRKSTFADPKCEHLCTQIEIFNRPKTLLEIVQTDRAMSMYARRQHAVATSKPRLVTAQQFEKRQMRRRADEGDIRTINRVINADAIAKTTQRSDERVGALRRQRRFQQQNDELEMEEIYRQRTHLEEERQVLADQDNRLAAALFAQKNATEARQAQERRICDQSDELKELRAKIEAARLSKARDAQVIQRDIRRKREQTLETALDKDQLKMFMGVKSREGDINAELERKKNESKQDLLSQIQDNERRKHDAYLQYMHEKREVDEVVAKLEASDRIKAAQEAEKQAAAKREIQLYLQQREQIKLERKQEQEADVERDRQHQIFMEQRHQEEQAIIRAQKKKRDALKHKATAEIERKRQEEENVRNMLEELYQEQAEQAAWEAEKAKEAKEIKSKRDMVAANDRQKVIRAERARAIQREEHEFKTKMLEKFAADARIAEQERVQGEEQKRVYMSEVKNLMQMRRDAYDRAITEEQQERSRHSQQEEARKAVVERERQRLLAEVADELRDYLPPGALQTNEDYELVHGKKIRQEQSYLSQLDAGQTPFSHDFTNMRTH
jgi:hypothetical protein